MYFGRTDLALEVKESFPKDQVEISGVCLAEEVDQTGKIKRTVVDVQNEYGAKRMGKPVGRYVTLEFSGESMEKRGELDLVCDIQKTLRELVSVLEKKERKKFSVFLFSGLGNRLATPDALGPYVLEKLTMNRHLMKEQGKKIFCGIVPGVLAQTGMESSEILQGIIHQVKPDVLVVIDALASASVNRLCRTIQLTDTGIAPGAGIGNNRAKINQETMGIPVIAIGVPTVVEAGTIVRDALRETFLREGYQEEETEQLLSEISHERFSPLFVTPKEIDEEIQQIGTLLAKALEEF